MTADQQLPIYCLTFKDELKRQNMINRFVTCGLQLTCVEGIDAYDPEICPPKTLLNVAKSLNRWEPPVWSCMHGHLKILKKIIEQPEDLAIVCEYDVFIYRDFAKELPNIINNFYRLNLDILMLGYLTMDKPFRPEYVLPHLLPVTGYFSYEHDPYLWGTQMYMISKKHAAELLEKFGPDKSIGLQHLIDVNAIPFSPDWLLTKQGRRAFISPMMAVSRREQHSDPDSPFHNATYDNNYDPELYV